MYEIRIEPPLHCVKLGVITAGIKPEIKQLATSEFE
jgi:hypothetical protein